MSKEKELNYWFKKYLIYFLCICGAAFIVYILNTISSENIVSIGLGDFILQIIGGLTVIFKIRKCVGIDR